MKNPTIISLGGSLIVPDEIDVPFVSAFKQLIEKEVASDKSFILITGGGKICRRYQKAGTEISGLSNEELDWLGIHVTRLNAEFMRIVFGSAAHPNIIIDPTTGGSIKESLAIGAGWKPGWSTDFVAVLMAKTLGAKRIVNLSNIDYAYDKDPNKYPDAKKIEKISWKEFREIIPAEWSPGVNTPFDPIAAREAEELGIEVAIMNGKNLANLESYLNGRVFQGTVISG